MYKLYVNAQHHKLLHAIYIYVDTINVYKMHTHV